MLATTSMTVSSPLRASDCSYNRFPPLAAEPAPPSSTPRKMFIYFNNVASIVCLLWFNDMNLLTRAFNEAQTYNSYSAAAELSPHTLPTAAFKQFVVNVINRTQLPPTAVSLALLYVLRLKKMAPVPIVGSADSEYRVFSVAMILANKYLDDNTYTNKTWSDITRLPLAELSAMEIEFLTNMHYRTYVKVEQWRAWQRQLKVWLNIHYAVMSMGNAPVTPGVSPLPLPGLAQHVYAPLASPTAQSCKAQAQLPVPASLPIAPDVFAPIAAPVMPYAAPIPQMTALPTPSITPATLKRNYTLFAEDTKPFMPEAKRHFGPAHGPIAHALPIPPLPSVMGVSNSTSPESMQPSFAANVIPIRTLSNAVPPPLVRTGPMLSSAPVYYVLSQKKTFSPHYGYLPSTDPSYLLPQQYQFELQHYTPSTVVRSRGPVTTAYPQFLSPAAPSLPYWRTPPAVQHFSSPPSHMFR